MSCGGGAMGSRSLVGAGHSETMAVAAIGGIARLLTPCRASFGHDVKRLGSCLVIEVEAVVLFVINGQSL